MTNTPRIDFSFFNSRYVLVYFSILHLRYHAGLVTDEMLSLPKTPYIVVGILEALGAVSGMAAGGDFFLSFYLSISIYLYPSLPRQCSFPWPTLYDFQLVGIISDTASA